MCCDVEVTIPPHFLCLELNIEASLMPIRMESNFQGIQLVWLSHLLQIIFLHFWDRCQSNAVIYYWPQSVHASHPVKGKINIA